VPSVASAGAWAGDASRLSVARSEASATSSWSSSGSTVVIFCTAKPGQSSTRSGPRVQNFAVKRCSSKVMAAMTGMKGSLSAKSATFSSSAFCSPKRGKKGAMAVKTMTLTSATSTKKVVPQRGCSVVFARAFATIRSSDAS
jgi:hypothetical protein